MPRPTLTLEQIVSAAIELLDTEGLDGLSMRKLGTHLNAAATAMYWHVGNREELVVLAAQKVWANLELPEVSERDWRTGAQALARETLTMLTEHQWLVSAVFTHFATGDGLSRYKNRVLMIFEAAGLKGFDLDHALATFFHYVLGSAGTQIQNAQLRQRLQNDPDADARAAEILTAEQSNMAQYPLLAERVDACRARGDSEQDLEREQFDFGLDVILDGLERRVPAP